MHKAQMEISPRLYNLCQLLLHFEPTSKQRHDQHLIAWSAGVKQNPFWGPKRKYFASNGCRKVNFGSDLNGFWPNKTRIYWQFIDGNFMSTTGESPGTHWYWTTMMIVLWRMSFKLQTSWRGFLEADWMRMSRAFIHCPLLSCLGWHRRTDFLVAILCWPCLSCSKPCFSREPGFAISRSLMIRFWGRPLDLWMDQNRVLEVSLSSVSRVSRQKFWPFVYGSFLA